MGHTGSDGSTMRQRIERFCVYNSGMLGENVGQECKTDNVDHELESVLSLIIDDGVESRGHRRNIFNP